MRDILRDVLDIDGVQGLIMFSAKGDVMFKEFSSPGQEDPENKGWWTLFFGCLRGVREADIVFENGRLYIRRTEMGYLMILMGAFVSSAMIRLQCDMILPSLKKAEPTTGIKRLFNRKK
jgi:hypothetical protein